MKYAVTYTETLSRTLIIEAEDAGDAEGIMEHLVEEEYIVLDSADFVDCEYETNEADDDDIDFYDDAEDEFPYAMQEYREMMEEDLAEN